MAASSGTASKNRIPPAHFHFTATADWATLIADGLLFFLFSEVYQGAMHIFTWCLCRESSLKFSLDSRPDLTWIEKTLKVPEGNSLYISTCSGQHKRNVASQSARYVWQTMLVRLQLSPTAYTLSSRASEWCPFLCDLHPRHKEESKKTPLRLLLMAAYSLVHSG